MKNESPSVYALKFAVLSFITALSIFAIALTITKHLQDKKVNTPSAVFNENDNICFVLDAGHGGEDAGAVAKDGTLEKDLNLEIAMLLKEILELNGSQVVMTRQEDTLLYDKYGDLEDYTGKKKVYDLKNRLKIAEEQENSIYVGIHMNKFPEEKYNGLQVYYSPNTELSKEIASCIRDTVKATLQPNNNRNIKRGDSSIYILNEAEMPAVLIECGFLSNKEELDLIKNRDYQKSLTLCLFSSLVKYE